MVRYLLLATALLDTSPAVPVGPLARVEPSEIRFGERPSGPLIEADFTLTNTGSAPLLISDVQTSCGCTVPRYSRRPLAPGARQQLHIRFDTKGRAGIQRKTLVVLSNSTGGPLILTLSGTLTPAAQ